MSDTPAVQEEKGSGPFGGLSPAEAAKRRWEKEASEIDEALDSFEEVMRNPKSMIGELVNAALGRGKWKQLPIDKRLAALIKANEYVNGRPLPMRPDEDDTDLAGFQVGMAEERPDDGPNMPGLPGDTT